MRKNFYIILFLFIIISCMSDNVKEKNSNAVDTFLEEFDIVTTELVQKFIIQYKFIMMSEKEAKEGNIDFINEFLKLTEESSLLLKKRNEMAKIWYAKYYKYTRINQRRRKEIIDEKTKNIDVDGVLFSIAIVN